MRNRITNQLTICLAMVTLIPIAQVQAQSSQSTRIFRGTNPNQIDDLDPTQIDSEIIEQRSSTVQNDFHTNRGRQPNFDAPANPFGNSIPTPVIQTTSPNDRGIHNPIQKSANSFNQESNKATQPSQNTFLQDQNSNNQIPINQLDNRNSQINLPIHFGQNSGISNDLFNAPPPPSPGQQTINSNSNRQIGFSTVSLPNRVDGNLFETKSTPTIQTQIMAPKATNLNQPARFFIQAQNVGTENVGTIKLIATLPDHAQFVNSDPQPSEINGQQYQFLINGLNARDKQIIQLDVVPTAKMPLSIDTQIQIMSQQHVAVAVQQPILEIAIDGPEMIQTGQTIKHEIIVTNIGDGIAEQVRIDTQRPEQLEVGTQPQKTLVPKLIPGQSAKFELTSFATAAGNSNMIFQVSAMGAETQQAKSEIRVVRPELGVQLLGPNQNYLGREGIYTIQLQNISKMPITQVGVQLIVSPGLQIETISQQAHIDKARGTLTWMFDSIPGDQQQVIQFKTRSTAIGNQSCQLSVQTKETASRQMTLQTDIWGRADLSIRVNDAGAPIGVGNKADFIVEIANNGSQTAEQVAVRVELPNALMPVNQTGYAIDPSGNFITFNNLIIEPGQAKTLQFKVVAVTLGEHIVRGSVTMLGSSQTISAEDSVLVFETENAKVSEALVPDIQRR